MKYEELEEKLLLLEKTSRDDFKLDAKLGVGAQFFVLDNTTKDKDLPVVVLFGVNYWQCLAAKWKPEVEDSTFLYKGVSPQNEDSTLVKIRNRLSQDWPNNPVPKNEFHMVFANLSPIITFKSWGEMSGKEQRGLLEDGLKHESLIKLKDVLQGDEVIWIGHTKSVYKELIDGFKNAQIDNYMLSWNISWLGDPHFEPNKG